jgi:hypothetical protein
MYPMRRSPIDGRAGGVKDSHWLDRSGTLKS